MKVTISFIRSILGHPWKYEWETIFYGGSLVFVSFIVLFTRLLGYRINLIFGSSLTRFHSRIPPPPTWSLCSVLHSQTRTQVHAIPRQVQLCSSYHLHPCILSFSGLRNLSSWSYIRLTGWLNDWISEWMTDWLADLCYCWLDIWGSFLILVCCLTSWLSVWVTA